MDEEVLHALNKEDTFASFLKKTEGTCLLDGRESYFKHIETHMSVVCLVGKFAFKFKKPVNFGFVDFSTIEKRKHFCKEEVSALFLLCLI